MRMQSEILCVANVHLCRSRSSISLNQLYTSVGQPTDRVASDFHSTVDDEYDMNDIDVGRIRSVSRSGDYATSSHHSRLGPHEM